ncbi:PAS domain-containing sensor histidine kinase [Paenibacillus agricola]|uniref:histidine kinase n=1 Tax=Paenibacillus agricola TaxID=2716264 RepID=A0ABX0IZT8_9BACL|nr:PAS domain S-box protein [Paenibacillus agricola]NHN29076.1 PAS domain S-box protein [Paenibacillus agricola]
MLPSSIDQLGRELSQLRLHFEHIFNNIDVAIWSLEPLSNHLTVSAGYKKLFGYSQEEFNRNENLWKELIYVEDIGLVEDQFVLLISGQSSTVEHRLVLHNGEIRWVQSIGTPVLDSQGKVIRINGVVLDITARKTVEEALNHSEQRYKSLFEYNSHLICEIDLNGTIISINRATEDLAGFSLQHSWVELFGIQDVQRLSEFLEKAKQGLPQNYETSSCHKNGKLFYWDIKQVPIYINNEIVGVFAICRDITSQKSTEKALATSQCKYRLITENMSDLIGVVDIEGNLLHISNLALGFESESIIGTSGFDYIHPEDLDYVQIEFAEIMKNQTNKLIQCRLVHADGHTIHTDAMFSPVMGDDGEVILVVIVARDINEKVTMEKELEESEERYRRLVELSPRAIFVHDHYKYTYVNPAGLSLYGASSLEDIIGKSVFDNIHPDDKVKVAIRLKDVYERSTTSPLVQQKIIRFDGTIIDVDSIATSLPSKGRNAGLTMMGDITERKKAEDDRKQAEQMIRESEELYYLLQTSLDRFSHDLFSVMKISEVEWRLIKEVREITGAEKVSILIVDHNNKIWVTNGDDRLSSKLLQDIMELNPKDLPICEIITMPDAYLIKIGEFRGLGYFLCMDEQSACLHITAQRVWLKTITRYVSVLYDNFRIIEDLTKDLEQLATHQIAPSWLLRLLFSISENERKRLSQDLHDSALQEQIIWYRILDQISTDLSVPKHFREHLQQVTQGLLDVIYQIRITCNELRPPMLKEEGIVSSLQALFDLTQLRTNFCIHFDSGDFQHSLTDDLLIGVYRIVQELLANASKHSNSSRVQVKLSSQQDKILLTYEDNGIGMELSQMEDSFNSMGVYGMKERVRSLNGRISFQSAPDNGFAVFISIPIH